MKPSVLILIALLVCVKWSAAQNFKLLRFEEEYIHLKDSSRTFYNKLKFIPLSSNGNGYFSFGGEVRLELDRAENEDWGSRNLGRDVFLLQRYNLHGDLQLNRRLRIFSQLRSGQESGRRNGPRPIDEDELNIQNLFVDFYPYYGKRSRLLLRVGRQELQYGSGRLLDVREGTNLRLYFDGAKAAFKSSKFNIDGFFLKSGGANQGIFDNQIGSGGKMWGLYGTLSAPKLFNTDFYYLGIDRNQGRFDEGNATELRHTFGTRIWRNGVGLFYNFEGGFQSGRFASKKIMAGGGSSEVGYKFANLRGRPVIKLRGDVISGDKSKGDGRLGTFNPLFPNGGYFGMNPQAGPANLISFHPSLAFNALEQVQVSVEVVFNWRHSEHDGIYRPDGSLNLPSSNVPDRYIGTTYLGSVSWKVNRFINFNFGIQYFDTGNFINAAIAQHKNGFFIASMVSIKF